MELRCKLCGGRLLFHQGSFSAQCDSCGVCQLLFDYLDKDSDNYDEHVEQIRSEKEAFENTYLQYADDVINADSYCLTSEDLRKIIRFFEDCGAYEDAPALLALAKLIFIGKVSSLSDCSLAVKYIEESNDFTYEEKQGQKQVLSDLAMSFAVAELDKKGYLAILPRKNTAENILRIANKILDAKKKNLKPLNTFEIEIVQQYLNDAVEYIKDNALSAMESCTNIHILHKLKDLIPDIKAQFDELKSWDIEDPLAGKIASLAAENRLIEQQQLEMRNAERRKKRLKKAGLLAIVILVAIGVACSVFYHAKGYSSDNLRIAVVSKTNLTFNENLVTGHYQSGYFYTFTFAVDNSSKNDIALISGTMEILNLEGKSLAVSSIDLRGDLKGGSSKQWEVRLQVDKGENAREIWNTELENLKITFRIQKANFSDGTTKTYHHAKAQVVHPLAQKQNK